MIAYLWREWIVQTLFAPRDVAHKLMALDMRRDHLWMALVVLVAVSTVLSSLPAVLAPPPTTGLTAPEIMVYQLSQRPFILAMISFAMVAISVFGLYWTGKSLGGTGRLEDMLVLLVWLQFVWLLLQIAVVALAVVLPPVAGMGFMLLFGVTIWVYLNFVDCAHGFNSMLKALGVTIVWVVGLLFGMSVLLALMGVSAAGVNGNV